MLEEEDAVIKADFLRTAQDRTALMQDSVDGYIFGTLGRQWGASRILLFFFLFDFVSHTCFAAG